MIPHITDAIQEWVERVAKITVDDMVTNCTPDVCIIEVSQNFVLSKMFSSQPAVIQHFLDFQLGGTIGDIESMPFIEAFRQFQFRVGRDNFCSVHVSLVPVQNGEHKTKPTQNSVKELRGLGINPDIVRLFISSLSFHWLF